MFASTLGLVALLAPYCSFGIGGLWLSVFGQEGWRAIRWLRNSFKLVAFSTLMVATALVMWAQLGPHDNFTEDLFMVLLVCIFGQASAELLAAKLQLESRYASLAALPPILHATRLTLLVVSGYLYDSGPSPSVAAYSFAAGSLLITLLGCAELSRMYVGDLALVGHGLKARVAAHDLCIPSARLIARRALPFGLTASLYLVYYQSDVVLLKYLQGDEAAGIYGAGFAVIAAVYVFPSVVYQRFMQPMLHRWAQFDALKFERAYRAGSASMMLAGLLAAGVCALCADAVVSLVFGVGYEKTVTVLYVLSVAIPARFFGASAGASLSTGDHIAKKARILAVGALVNVLINLTTIPAFGAMGAAVSTVVTETLIALLMHRYAKRNIFGSSKVT
ncbi:MAG: polysaccharide biosynthesis C-terminal domain-containing protein [Pseudomonadota bacterium]